MPGTNGIFPSVQIFPAYLVALETGSVNRLNEFERKQILFGPVFKGHCFVWVVFDMNHYSNFSHIAFMSFLGSRGISRTLVELMIFS